MGARQTDSSTDSRLALVESEGRLQETITIRKEADEEFAILRNNLERNHFADSVRRILTGGNYGT